MEIEVTKSDKKAPRGRRRTHPRNERVDYVLEIKDWDWSFSFGLNYKPERDGPYYDFRHLELRGDLIRPKKISASGAAFTLLPDLRLNEDQRDRHVWKGVGSVRRSRGTVSGLLSVPADVLPLLLQMLIAHRFRYLSLSGERLHYGHATIRTYTIETTIDDEDMPVD